MSKAKRILVIGLVAATVTVAAGVSLATAAIVGAGTIAVDVRETRGDRVSVHVPAGLAEMALFFVPSGLVDHFVEEIDVHAAGEVRDLLPTVRAVWNELEASPDFVLVEVNDGDEHVVIEKRNRRILITVQSDDADVSVSIPVRTVDRLLSKI